MYNVPDCALITKKARVLAFACNIDFPEQPKLVKRRMQCSTDKDMGQANYQKKGGHGMVHGNFLFSNFSVMHTYKISTKNFG